MSRHPRHPAEVTLMRLMEALDKWPEAFGPGERDEVSHIIHILDQIAEGVPLEEISQ